jgi:hypothetical protein
MTYGSLGPCSIGGLACDYSNCATAPLGLHAHAVCNGSTFTTTTTQCPDGG